MFTAKYRGTPAHRGKRVPGDYISKVCGTPEK